ncbi:N-acyl homoserine lactonase family protein [Quisquiliibacterium transsilvanicum]|uniref:Glyoxylase-like metal-dependent hydrolase (Beta-lactamase superfamily II) n=1 Tax=Quisquiliibacterium transsilvanicum TaxID=1549638 RepID=A0A7W8M8D4_9BURK|nr:N-acyl homoserine lactonase family protein [Quisquiliibacterium transsilvanicum]MBB5271693.1 glyoxylase-like metal-dependent hydrolase (beta-lactamase superfamily II) [Quisquiliibacterium transsilvanicum]
MNRTDAATQYEVYAIRYASVHRMRSDNFIGHDPHDGPMPLDFFVWLLRGGGRNILVDTGFNAQSAASRGRVLTRCPIESLRVFGLAPEDISDVVLTHLHYDHAGNLDKLPKARFHVQDAELDFATGRCMCHAQMRHAYSVDDVVGLVRKVYADRVVFHAGDATITPGVDLLLIGGHTRGLQSVRVATQRGRVVLASDASHYYENLEQGRPFPIVYNVADMLDGHRRLLAEADSPEHVVPGHDPLVLQRYPRLEGDELGIACLHLPPRG